MWGWEHTLFTLEDNYGLKISELDGEICLKVDVRKSKDAAQLHEMLCSWQQVASKLEAGEISKEELRTSGATTTRSLIRPSAGQRYLRRNFVIYQYKMFD